MKSVQPSVAVIGAGIAGVSTAYYLAKNHGRRKIALIDRGSPMAFTSAQSGENYRNWWPHPVMVAFIDRSIDLLEGIARESGNRINMTRRGYALATRADDISGLDAQFRSGLGKKADRLLRYHTGKSSDAYACLDAPNWTSAPDGIDILRNRTLIEKHFPGYDPDVRTVVHIRRGGDIAGQQLGAFMLDYLKSVGARMVTGKVAGVEIREGFRIEIEGGGSRGNVEADELVNAAGPFAGRIAAMLGLELPVRNVFQQKIAFEDRAGAVPRNRPFSVDLDDQKIDWTKEEREILETDPDFAWAAGEMPGAIHCRPDGGDKGKWIKLGWAYNVRPAEAVWDPPLDPHFPEIVLRGASRLQPALKAYFGRLPGTMHHYGGWYTMTEENWPLVGRMNVNDAYMVCALSGFGTMAACAAGELCAATIAGGPLPDYADALALSRCDDDALMTELRAANKGIL